MAARKEFQRAVREYRTAAGLANAARDAAPAFAPELPDRQRRIITRLAQAATVITPGWLGRALTRATDPPPLGGASGTDPLAVRIGECEAGPDHRFPVVVNLLGTGHLCVDADADDPRALSIVQSVPLRLLAARPADSFRVSLADLSGHGVFADFTAIETAGLTGPVAVDATGLDRILAETESHIASARRRHVSDLPERLVVLSGLHRADPRVVARLTAFAAAAVSARLHLVVAGWRGGTLPATTHVSMKGPQVSVAGVPLPVVVDGVPDPEVVRGVCADLADQHGWLIGDPP
ncbi:hypothetical protein LX16_3830 [Stackebrandtia albiflava]|uniref:Uncharacterized protein n=1 Tax=Stackebrandtia albiflava TaxID=406432 RepID=A0A562V5J7_9ACTN|nr:hypothetical protein [Stackebrandtia albiflava]TWJ13062.1 hypothetical protein LX16_3830 [Stackebrandtia albiflava]